MSKLDYPRRRAALFVVANRIAELATVANEDAPAVANKHGQYADKEKRKAYMAEYMRKRRAK